MKIQIGGEEGHLFCLVFRCPPVVCLVSMFRSPWRDAWEERTDGGYLAKRVSTADSRASRDADFRGGWEAGRGFAEICSGREDAKEEEEDEEVWGAESSEEGPWPLRLVLPSRYLSSPSKWPFPPVPNPLGEAHIVMRGDSALRDGFGPVGVSGILLHDFQAVLPVLPQLLLLLGAVAPDGARPVPKQSVVTRGVENAHAFGMSRDPRTTRGRTTTSVGKEWERERVDDDLGLMRPWVTVAALFMMRRIIPFRLPVGREKRHARWDAVRRRCGVVSRRLEVGKGWGTCDNTWMKCARKTEQAVKRVAA